MYPVGYSVFRVPSAKSNGEFRQLIFTGSLKAEVNEKCLKFEIDWCIPSVQRLN